MTVWCSKAGKRLCWINRTFAELKDQIFRLTLRAAQGFIDSIFALMGVPLRCPDYSCVSMRAKSVSVSFKTATRGEIAHLVIDSTGLKVFGEGAVTG